LFADLHGRLLQPFRVEAADAEYQKGGDEQQVVDDIAAVEKPLEQCPIVALQREVTEY